MFFRYDVNKGIISCFLLILTVLQTLSHFNELYFVSCLVSIALNVLILAFFWNRSLSITILFSFSLMFLFVPVWFFGFEKFISYHLSYQTPFYFSAVAIVNSLFLVSLFIGLGNLKEPVYRFKIYGRNRSLGFFLLYFFILVLILFFGIRGETLLNASYGTGQLEKSTLHEYFIPIFLALLFVSNPSCRIQRIIIFMLMIAYALKTLLFGGRIEVLIIALLYVYVVRDYYLRRRFMFVIGSLVGYIILSIFGELRANLELIDNIGSFRVFSFISEREYESSLFGDVYQSSQRMVGLVNDGYLSIETRISSFILAVFALLPTSWLPDYYNLASYRRDVALSGGGGLISAFSFAWLSYFGPVLFGVFVGLAIRKSYFSASVFFQIYGLLVLVFFPRWFSYYPIILFKICFFGALLCYLTSKIRVKV